MTQKKPPSKTIFGYAAPPPKEGADEPAAPHAGQPPAAVPAAARPAPAPAPVPAAPVAPPAAARPASPSPAGGAGAAQPPTPQPPQARRAENVAARPPEPKNRGGDKNRKQGFRETMWFKKGELDEAAALAASTADTKSTLPPADKADEMPIEDRYSDDGTLTSADQQRLSLRTGATQMMEAVPLPATGVAGAAKGMSEAEMIDEFREGRNKIVLIVAGVAFLLVVALAWVLFSGPDRPQVAPDAATADPAAAQPPPAP